MSAHDPDARLKELGIVLPDPPAALASYVPAVRTGALVFVSGQVPIEGGALAAVGMVPSEVTLDGATSAARRCAINGLAVLRGEIGGLDRVRRVVRVGCFVACEPGFTDHPAVANGASQLLHEVFGDRGRHARAAVGCPSLPLGAPVEVEFLFEVG